MSLNRSTSEICKALNQDSALKKHVARFCLANNDFTPQSVSAGLNVIHGTGTTLKGAVISSFNATHSSSNIVCPVTGARFEADEKTGYAKFLHMGTTRIWNADGSINEDRWKLFVDFVTEGQEANDEKIVTKSRLKAYLTKCYNDDPVDLSTGRNTNSWFSSKYVQGSAASAGWDEVFDRLACGWKQVPDHPTQFEPCLTLAIIREFFEDSVAAFQKAEDRVLPAAKPSM